MFVSAPVVERAVTYADTRGEIHPQNRSQLDADFYLLRTRQQLIGLRIWSLTDARLIYRDPDTDRNPPDDAAPLAAELVARARAGRPFATGSAAAAAEETITVFYPVRRQR